MSRVGVVLFRTGAAVLRSVISGERNLQAGLLTYTTLVTIIPTLAVSFAVLSAFGGIDRLQDQALSLVFRYLTPHTASGVADQLRAVVDRLRDSPIGALGLVFVALGVITLLGQIEAAFNKVWEAPRGRSVGQRLAFYWSVATLAPLLIATGLALSARLPLSGRFVSTVIGWTGFFAAYKLLPNRRVKIGWAVLGAVVAGTLFEVAARAFSYWVTSVVDYSTLYGSLAAIPMFLAWLFIMWHIVLAGCEVARANQDPARYARQIAGDVVPVREALGLALACARARTAQGGLPLDIDDVAQQLLVPEREVEAAAHKLEEAGLVRGVGDWPDRHYVLARPSREIRVREVVDALDANSAALPAEAFAEATLAELVKDVDANDRGELRSHDKTRP